MKDAHLHTARIVAADLARQGDAQAVLLHGSVALAAHRADSDIDLLVVGPGDAGLRHRNVNRMHVEIIARSFQDWEAVLERPLPAWAYAWAEGEILFEADTAGTRLRASASHVLRTFRAPPEQLREHLEFWRHVRPKLAAALSQGDAVETGYAASLSLPQLRDTLFLLNDQVPRPASSSQTFSHLLELKSPPRVKERLASIIVGAHVEARARAQLALIDEITCLIRQTLASNQL